MPDAVEQQVLEEIASRKGAMLANLRTYVDLPTGPGSGREPIESLRLLLSDRAAALDAKVSLVPTEPRPGWLYEGEHDPREPVVIPDTAICRREEGDGVTGRPLLLAGHLDTVHAVDSKFRTLDVSDDKSRAVGPGCSDMKGGLVIAVHALEALDACGIRLPWTLLLNADEETGSFGSAEAIRAEARRLAEAGGVGLAVEPSLPDGGMVDVRAGSGQFMIKANGRSAHVGRAFASGASAVVALAGAITRIAQLPRPNEGLIVNIGPIRGGATTNAVPNQAWAWGNIRFPDAAGARKLLAEIKLACQINEVPGTSLSMETAIGRPAKPRVPGTEGLTKLVAGVCNALSTPVSFTSTGGVCDGNLMQDEGLATLDTLGVVGGGLHTPDEWIDLSTMADRCSILALTMLRASRGERV